MAANRRDKLRFNKKIRRYKNEGVPEYYVTYSDTTTLLLTFFIILLTTAKIEGEPLQIILANFPGLGKLLGGTTFTEGPLPSSGFILDAPPSIESAESLDRLRDRFQNIIENNRLSDVVRATIDERGLVVTLASDYFFDKYSAQIKLREVGSSLRLFAQEFRVYINAENPAYRIEGHSDEENFPKGSNYSDNWELSVGRSVSILHFFRQLLLPTHKAQVTGFGNTRPYIEAESPLNRRVDIIILDEGNL